MPLFRRAKIINNFDLIIDCTDKLLSNWRARPSQHIHCDIVQQCQKLLLEIFGLISFDYDLETLDECNSSQNELTKALHDFMSIFEWIFFLPPILGTIYTKLSPQHRRAKAIIERYIYQMIDNEMAETQESIAQRKRTCLILHWLPHCKRTKKRKRKRVKMRKKVKFM